MKNDENTKPVLKSQMERRIIVGPCRSGTTALLHAFSQHPEVKAVYQPVKSALRTTGLPNYDFFEAEEADPSLFSVAKETIGHKTREECTLAVFPNDEAIRATRPCFIVREPVATYASWLKLGWGNETLFADSYEHTAALFEKASSVSDQTCLLIQEELAANPEILMKTLCLQWGIPFRPELVNWPKRLGADSPIHRWIHSGSEKGFEAAHHQKLRDSTGFEVMGTREDPPPPEISERIRERLLKVYKHLQESRYNLNTYVI